MKQFEGQLFTDCTHTQNVRVKLKGKKIHIKITVHTLQMMQKMCKRMQFCRNLSTLCLQTGPAVKTYRHTKLKTHTHTRTHTYTHGTFCFGMISVLPRCAPYHQHNSCPKKPMGFLCSAIQTQTFMLQKRNHC